MMEAWVLIIQLVLQGQPMQVSIDFVYNDQYNLTRCMYSAYMTRKLHAKIGTDVIMIECFQSGRTV